ncbi:Cell division control protein 48 homolog C [Linum perenne]
MVEFWSSGQKIQGTAKKMGSGRRFSSGGGSSGGRNLLKLRKDVEACRMKGSTVDDIVQHLRQQFPNYRRMAHQALARNVRQIIDAPPSSFAKKLQKRPSKEEEEEGDDYEEGRASSSRKKKKRTDESEEEMQLQRMENKRLRKINSNRSSDSSESESDSESQSTPSSTSEDAEPEFDLMKSMLRNSYAPEKNIEVEVASSSKDKIAMVNGSNGGKGKGGRVGKSGGKGLSSDNMEVKPNKEGPRFKDFGGLKKVLDDLETEVLMPLYHPHLLQRLGVRPVSGILLHGPPGCGKTKLAHAIANETGVPFYKISATEAVSGVSGASEEYIRDLFSKAYRTAPSIIFIDEIDAIGSKRENLQREMERRIVTQLMTCMEPADDKSKSESSELKTGYVLVIAATNRPDAIDSALRRPGRFDREIMLGVPDEDARVHILSVLTKKCTLEGSLDLSQIARLTPGFVGADLDALSSKAGNLALRRIAALRRSTLLSEGDDQIDWWKTPWSAEEIEKLAITMEDFEQAAKLVQPSLTREGFSSVPNVTWEDVGGLQKIRNELESYVVQCIKNPKLYQHFGVSSKTGILLFGPPGCGKTLIAKAAANEAGANFIHVKGPELLNKYVGESELAVRNLFTRARHCLPCIIFIDEVDALTTTRGREGGWVVERPLNQLLIELDGADQRQGVFVIGATNRPEVMDPAILRPGRLGNHVLVPLPSAEDRGLILKALARGKPIDPSVDLAAIGQMESCQNLSGADLNKLMEDAAMIALQEAMKTGSTDEEMMTLCRIKMSHFEQALEQTSPSVTGRVTIHIDSFSLITFLR